MVTQVEVEEEEEVVDADLDMNTSWRQPIKHPMNNSAGRVFNAYNEDLENITS